MACYIIAYDLKSPGKDYQPLYDAIKSYGTWAHIQDSVWAVVTDGSSVDVREHLSSFMDGNDSLFVIKSGVAAAWKNVRCRNEWLKKHL